MYVCYRFGYEFKKKTLELYIEPLKNALLYREIIDAESLV